jgi:type I restriction enzyme, S subunit
VSDWKTVSLGDAVIQMKTGSTPSTTHPEYFGGDTPWFTPGDIGASKALLNSTRTITQDAVSFGKAKLFEKDTLLVTCIGDIGRVGILQQTSSSNQQITALKFNNDISSDFAYYWFVHNKQILVNLANQAIVPILNNERLSEIEFAYPPLTEQKRIASLLARADRLRQLRRTAHDLGNELLQSVFLEMFGNIAVNERGFPKSSLEELCSRVTVGYVGSTSEFYADDGIPFLRTQNVRPIQINRAAMQYVTQEFHKKNKKSQIYKNDVLVSRVGVNRGMAAVVPEDLEGANCANVLIASPSTNLNSFFLAYLINSPVGQEQLLGISVGSAQGVINTNSLRDWVIAVPPLSLQEEFAGIVKRIEGLRTRMSEAERQVEGLFDSLLSESFGGEHVDCH